MTETHLAPRELWLGGPEVGPIGLGTWGLGGVAYGPIAESDAVSVIAHALERGITFIDTSDLYGNGRAERLVGRACTGQRHKAIIATKGGMLPHNGLRELQDFSVSHLQPALEASLARLGADYVDIYFLHSPPLTALEGNEELFRFMDATKQKGLARGIGVSAKSPRDALAALSLYPFDLVEVNFNLVDQRALDEGLLAHLAKSGGRMIARTPYCFGFLTGEINADTRFASGDHRANWPRDQLLRWAQAPEVFSPVAERLDRSIADLALHFCLAPSPVACAVPGMMTSQQVEANLRATTQTPLTEDDLDDIRRLYAKHEFFDPSARHRGQQ